MITDKQLTDLTSLCEAATPSPWRWSDIKDSGSGGCHKSLVDWVGLDTPINEEGRSWWLGSNDFDADASAIRFRDDGCHILTQDADFIAAARTAVPELMGEVLRLRRLLQSVNEEVMRCICLSDRDIRGALRLDVMELVKDALAVQEAEQPPAYADSAYEIDETLIGARHKLMLARGALSNLCKSKEIKDMGLEATVNEIDMNIRVAREMVGQVMPQTSGGHGN